MLCVSVGESDFNSCVKSIEGEKLAEIRLDLANYSNSEIEKIFSMPIDLVATCRPGKFSEPETIEKLKLAIKSGASYVDIELEAADDYKDQLIKLAREKDCKVIISYHDFVKTPSKRELVEIVNWCFESGGDIAKIACLVSSKGDNARLLSLYDLTDEVRCENVDDVDNKLIVIGMGDKGKISRISALLLGAPFTYASVNSGQETALGQIDRHKFNDVLESLKSV